MSTKELKQEDKKVSKIVFLDVDGTLIDYEAKMPVSAGKAVDQARATVIRFIFVRVVLKLRLPSANYVN